VTDTPPGRTDAAVAGAMLIGAMLAGAGVGYGLGSLVGAAVPLGLLGFFAGVVVGFAVVHARFRGV
jgi:hypothetical protein